MCFTLLLYGWSNDGIVVLTWNGQHSRGWPLAIIANSLGWTIHLVSLIEKKNPDLNTKSDRLKRTVWRNISTAYPQSQAGQHVGTFLTASNILYHVEKTKAFWEWRGKRGNTLRYCNAMSVVAAVEAECRLFTWTDWNIWSLINR